MHVVLSCFLTAAALRRAKVKIQPWNYLGFLPVSPQAASSWSFPGLLVISSSCATLAQVGYPLEAKLGASTFLS